MRKLMGIIVSMCLIIALAGCGTGSGNIDTEPGSSETEHSQTAENSEKPSSEDTQRPNESETQTPSESETQKPSESEKPEPSESETQKPSESEKPEPSESETQKPSESEKPEPSESETQKPSESESQKPSEPEKPSESESEEPSEPDTEEPSEKQEEYVLSTQTYEYAEQVSEKYYLVKENERYGLIDFNGNQIVPVKNEKVKLVAEDEIEFRAWGEEEDEENIYYAYVYSLDTGELIFRYIARSETNWKNKHKESILCNGEEHEILYGDPESDPIGSFEYNRPIYRDYWNGLLMETYLVFDCADSYRHGAVPRDYVSFTNVNTGKIIYEGYSTIKGYTYYYYDEDGEEYEEYYEGLPQVVEFSSNRAESKAVMLEYSFQEDKYYLVLINQDDYEKREMDDEDIGVFYYTAIDYSNDWVKMPYTALMINTKTMEIIDMAFEYGESGYWYVGIGEYFASTANNDETTYTIYKGAKAIATGYKSLYFSKYYILGEREDGKYAFIDYEGKEQLVVDDYGNLLNDRYIVNDGVGVYYVNQNLEKVSDYIYKGEVENCHHGAIKIDGKYYLIAKK